MSTTSMMINELSLHIVTIKFHVHFCITYVYTYTVSLLHMVIHAMYIIIIISEITRDENIICYVLSKILYSIT